MQKQTVERFTIIASGREVAEALGLELRNFQRLVTEGWIEGKRGRNEFDLGLCVQSYRSYLTRR